MRHDNKQDTLDLDSIIRLRREQARRQLQRIQNGDLYRCECPISHLRARCRTGLQVASEFLHIGMQGGDLPGAKTIPGQALQFFPGDAGLLAPRGFDLLEDILEGTFDDYLTAAAFAGVKGPETVRPS